MELFIVHKAFFNTPLRVRKIKAEDFEKVEDLIHGMQDERKIMADLQRLNPSGSETPPKDEEEAPKMEAYVAEAFKHEEKPIIGLIMIRFDPKFFARQCHIAN